MLEFLPGKLLLLPNDLPRCTLGALDLLAVTFQKGAMCMACYLVLTAYNQSTPTVGLVEQANGPIAPKMDDPLPLSLLVDMPFGHCLPQAAKALHRSTWSKLNPVSRCCPSVVC